MLHFHKQWLKGALVLHFHSDTQEQALTATCVTGGRLRRARAELSQVGGRGHHAGRDSISFQFRFSSPNLNSNATKHDTQQTRDKERRETH